MADRKTVNSHEISTPERPTNWFTYLGLIVMVLLFSAAILAHLIL